METIVELKNVYFAYRRQLILEDIDLTVKKGEFWAILGPNGGGKTTLLKLIVGLLKPLKGQVLVFNQPPAKVRHLMGYVPQHSTVNPLFPLTVFELVAMGCLENNRRGIFYSKTCKHKVYAALDKVNLVKLAYKNVSSLSGGELQRALVARALVNEPELLVFDEPTANIDPQGKVCLYELLSQLKSKMTIIVVTHDLVVSASSLDHLAAVNKKLVVSNTGSLDKAMLDLLYGVHGHLCPLNTAVATEPKDMFNKARGRSNKNSWS
ncbi:MAG: ABC transporter ATP-binding protein [Desulfonauticus sp.]|nr:ABC transporter ATP-binding protein [Desulfonauticus sp.]